MISVVQCAIHNYRQGSQRDGKTYCIITTELMLPKQKRFYILRSKQLSKYPATVVVLLPSSYTGADINPEPCNSPLETKQKETSVIQKIHSFHHISSDGAYYGFFHLQLPSHIKLPL